MGAHPVASSDRRSALRGRARKIKPLCGGFARLSAPRLGCGRSKTGRGAG